MLIRMRPRAVAPSSLVNGSMRCENMNRVAPPWAQSTFLACHAISDNNADQRDRTPYDKYPTHCSIAPSRKRGKSRRACLAVTQIRASKVVAGQITRVETCGRVDLFARQRSSQMRPVRTPEKPRCRQSAALIVGRRPLSRRTHKTDPSPNHLHRSTARCISPAMQAEIALHALARLKAGASMCPTNDQVHAGGHARP